MYAKALGHLHWPQSGRATVWVLLTSLITGGAGCGTVTESADASRSPRHASDATRERAREAVPLPMPPAPRLITVQAGFDRTSRAG